jgi:hypothetical protein
MKFVHGKSVPIKMVHFMAEAYDGSCTKTYIDDVVITRFGGSAGAAAQINARANANLDILFSENFEDGTVGAPPRDWAGKTGPPHAPMTAKVAHDPKHGKVLKMNGCQSGGDAFAIKTAMCTPQFKCHVSFFTKGRAYQGFADGYPGNHVWSAVPDPGYMDGAGVHAVTIHDNVNWHLVEYIFPMTVCHN